MTYPKSQPSHSNSLSSLSLLPQASQNIGSSSTSGSSCSLSSTVIYREVELSIDINISHYTCKIICTFDVFLITYLFKYCIFACMPGKNQVKHLSVYWACVYILKHQKTKKTFSNRVKQIIFQLILLSYSVVQTWRRKNALFWQLSSIFLTLAHSCIQSRQKTWSQDSGVPTSWSLSLSRQMGQVSVSSSSSSSSSNS